MAIFPFRQNEQTLFLFSSLMGLSIFLAIRDPSISFRLLSYMIGGYFGLLAVPALVDPELDYYIYGLPLEPENKAYPSRSKMGSSSPFVHVKTVRDLAIVLAIPLFEYLGNEQAAIVLIGICTMVKTVDAIIVAQRGGPRSYYWKTHAIYAAWLAIIVAIRWYHL